MSGESYALAYLVFSKWVTYLGVVVLTGACVARLFIVPRCAHRLDPDPAACDVLERQLRTVAVTAAALVFAGAVARLYAQTYSVFGLDEPVTLDLVWLIALESRWGGRWLAQGVAACGAMVAVGWISMQPRLGWWMVAVSVVALWVTEPMTGHTAALETHLPWVLQVVHGLAAGLWLGTLAAVMFGAVAMVRVCHPVADTWITALVQTFSPIALAAVGGGVLMGVLTSFFYFDSVNQLWSTVYGRILLAKVGLVAVTGSVGAYNWRTFRSRLMDTATTRLFFRSAGLELFLAMGLLALTALLVHLAIPHKMS